MEPDRPAWRLVVSTRTTPKRAGKNEARVYGLRRAAVQPESANARMARLIANDAAAVHCEIRWRVRSGDLSTGLSSGIIPGAFHGMEAMAVNRSS